METHERVFTYILGLIATRGLLRGKTLGIDATTLEANAALRSIVRRESGQAYNDFLKELAEAEGLENPTREELAKLDRKRPKKAQTRTGYTRWTLMRRS